MAELEVWVADITYIAIAAGFVYMATILDAVLTPGSRICDRPLN